MKDNSNRVCEMIWIFKVIAFVGMAVAPRVHHKQHCDKRPSNMAVVAKASSITLVNLH